jgi:acetyltransferase-like isoleucine patch superfamily enzyme
MQILKKTWWELRAESKGLALWFLAGIPGKLGQRARGFFMRYFLRRLGPHTVIQSGLRITNPESVAIGAHCNLAQGIFITGGGGVDIGDWVGFGPDVKIWSVNHRFEDPDRPWLQQGWDKKPVRIEDDVWLGAGVFVMPGITIGKGAIISACAVVNKTVPPYALVAGNPARVVGWRKRPADAPPAPTPAADSISSTA